MQKEIGGFIELDFSSRQQQFYKNVYKLNLARHAINILIEKRKYKKIYIPKYFTPTVTDNLKIPHEKYNVDNNFYPILKINKLKKNEAILYPNYFGINDKNVNKLTKIFKNIIIDNVHAFYQKKNFQDTIYSPRKFFGVPDGAYLKTKKKLKLNLERDISYKRFLPFIKKNELGSNRSYKEYLDVEKQLNKVGPKKMSLLTKKILTSINYREIKKIRIRNFSFLHERLKYRNEIKINILNSSVPMVYPYLNKKNKIEKLINKKIYIPKYYPGSKKFLSKTSFENSLIDHLICIPIDHRITIKDLQFILKTI